MGHDTLLEARDLSHVRFTLISDNAFADCENLKTIDFGCGLTHVGSSVSWYTFASSGLEKISFPRQLKRIGKGALYERKLK